MKIYTKTGDDGTTGLIGGQRVSKDHIRIEAYGALDELNAHLGLLIDQISESDIPYTEQLRYVQHLLFKMGSILATPSNQEVPVSPLSPDSVISLEQWIDMMEAELPQLQHFILPGGHPWVSQAHVCRTVCRRAERKVVTLSESAEVPITIVRFLNRLSDVLFVLSRHLGLLVGSSEIQWDSSL